MISTSLYFLPFISAFVGWLLSKLAIELFLKRIQAQQKIAAGKAGNYLAAGFSLDELAAKLSNEEAVEKILPFAEEHIDHFLRIKLPVAMPMLSMFISDKLVTDMKAIFMTELKELFPALINQYVSNAKESFNIEQLITDKIAAFNFSAIRISLKSYMNKIAFLGAAIGFITALIQIFLTLVA